MTATRVIAYAPNGDRLGPLPTPQDVQVGYPLNDVGALTLSYPPNAPRVDLLGQPQELVVEVSHDQGATWTEPPSSRFLYLRDGRDPIKTGDAYSVECSGYVQRLAKGLIGFTGLNDQGQRVFSDTTPGAILRTLILECQSRGALAGLTFDWSDAADSAGTAWPTTVSFTYEPGKSLLSVLQEFADQGLVDYRTQGRNVQMFVAETAMAVDRTTQATPVSLRFGRDLTEAPFRRTWENLADTALVKGDGTAILERTNPAAITPWGRQETYVTASGVTDAGTLQVIADQSLSLTERERTEHTFGLNFRSVPYLPFRDYGPGDWVYAVVNGSPERMRVRQVTLSRGADGVAGGNVILNDKFLESDVATQRSIQRLTQGATQGGTGTTPTGAGNDILQPATPTGLQADSLPYLDRGVPSTQVTLTWTAVTTNADGTTISDLDHYEVWRRTVYLDSPAGEWAQVAEVDGAATSWTDSPYPPGSRWEFRIRAVDRVYNRSGFSASVVEVMAEDVTPPPVPSQPVLLSRNGVLEARWDGKAADGSNMPGDLDQVQVHRSQVSGFVPVAGDPATIVGSLSTPGTVLVSAMFDAGDTWYVRLLAVDAAGNVSGPSAQAGATVDPIAEPDPPTAPTGTATPTIAPLGVGALLIGWNAVEGADRYLVYVSAAAIGNQPDPATFRGSTPDLNMAVSALPDGSPLQPGVVYHVRVIPANGDLVGPIGPEATGSTRLATSGDISPSYVYTGGVDAAQINTGNLTALLALLGGLTVGDLEGRHIEVNPTDGFRMIDANGAVIVSFPLDLNQVNRFEGDLVAHGFTSLGGFRLQGTDNEVSINSSLLLATGTSSPSTPPSWSSGYVQTAPIDPGAGGTGFSWNGSAFLAVAWEETGTDANGYSVYHARVRKIAPAGAVTFQILTELAAESGNWETYGIVQVGTDYVVAYRRMPGLMGGGDPAIRVGIFRASDGVQTSAFTANLQSEVGGFTWLNFGSIPNAPALGKDETGAILMAQVRASDRRLVVQRYSTAGALLETIVSDLPVSANSATMMASVERGTFDFGATRYVYKTADSTTIQFLNAAGVRTAAEDFDHPESSATRDTGVTWNGARFVSKGLSGQGGTLYFHSTAKTDETYYSGITYYDSNVAGSGYHETLLGPIQTIIRRKRYGISLSQAMYLLPGGGGVDDPDTVRVYLGGPASSYPGPGSMHLQTRAFQQTYYGSNYDVYQILDAPTMTGAAPPLENSFPVSGAPGTIVSESGGFVVRGDGSGDWPTFRSSIMDAVDDTVQSVLDAVVPVGTIFPWAGTGTNPPSGFLLCDGTAKSRTTYQRLFNVIGTAYGEGDGSTTFGLPDLIGRVIVGQDAGQAEFDTLGEKGGEKAHVLTSAESGIAPHTHTLGGSTGNDTPDHTHGQVVTANSGGTGVRRDYNADIAGLNRYPQGVSTDGASTRHTHPLPANTGTTAGASAAQGHNNLQPYTVLRYIIKT